MNKDKNLAQVFHFDLYGKRQEKYNFLLENNLQSIAWTELNPETPDYFFVPKDFSLKEEYEKGFKIDELFPVNSSGVKTHDDDNLVNFEPFAENNQKYNYRPFDIRFINYDLKKVIRHRYNMMQHFLKGENIGLCLMRSLIDTDDLKSVFVTKNMMDINFYRFQSYVFPLYLYHEHFGQTEKIVNLNDTIVNAIIKNLDNQENLTKITVQTIFDYIYAILHSPSYREKYKEFLKIDFPRIPYPENAEQFNKLAAFGEKLRHLHLDLTPCPSPKERGGGAEVANFPIAGSNRIEKIEFTIAATPLSFGEGQGVRSGVRSGKVWINDAQYFDHVPETAWNFYIGGYQPAQKWLKDRKGRELKYEDIEHYQKIIFVLTQTDRIMKEIDLTLQLKKKYYEYSLNKLC